MDPNEPPEHSRPIAEQVAERGLRMSDLLGRTVEEVRELGFEVSRRVPPGSVLQEEGLASEDVGLEATGRRTGYIWRGFAANVGPVRPETTAPTTDRPRLRLVPRPNSIAAAPDTRDEPLRVRFYPYPGRR